jgi:hypothetical protein
MLAPAGQCARHFFIPEHTRSGQETPALYSRPSNRGGQGHFGEIQPEKKIDGLIAGKALPASIMLWIETSAGKICS